MWNRDGGPIGQWQHHATDSAESSDAALVCMGLRAPEPDETPQAYAAYYRGLIAATDGLPLLLVLAARLAKSSK
jgi:hypothetical protein